MGKRRTDRGLGAVLWKLLCQPGWLLIEWCMWVRVEASYEML